MQANEALIPIGLKFYDELIRDIVEPLKHRTMLTHRKTAFNFKNTSLRYILEVSVALLETSWAEKALEVL